MNLSKILIIVVAIGAAILAMMFSQSFVQQPQQTQVTNQPAPPKVVKAKVLMAAKNLRIGQKVSAADLKWQDWPEDMILDSMIDKKRNASKYDEAIGSIVKVPMEKGDPIRFSKLINPEKGGVLSALLAPGMRAISTAISPETGAGGFILPNDKVDVILTTQDTTNNKVTRTILSNVKVLAIDQTTTEKDGKQVVVGKTATLELSPVQSEILASGNDEGTLTLSLRSISDRDVENDDLQNQRKKTMTILRHGKS